MNDNELLRYSRHILLPQLDIAGQQSILDSTALIIGLGGLGSPVAMYLAAAGVGELILVDDDKVDVSNLQRQIVHREKTIGLKKAHSALTAISELNPSIRVQAIDYRLSEQELYDLVPKVNVVLDCSDNVETRYLLNRVCLSAGRPLVSAAAIRFEGQLIVFDFRQEDSPCYRCLYDFQGEQQLTCSENGVFSPLLGVMGSMQALEALKIVAGLDTSWRGKLALFDALKNQWQYLILHKDPKCPVCLEK